MDPVNLRGPSGGPERRCNEYETHGCLTGGTATRRVIPNTGFNLTSSVGVLEVSGPPVTPRVSCHTPIETQRQEGPPGHPQHRYDRSHSRSMPTAGQTVVVVGRVDIPDPGPGSDSQYSSKGLPLFGLTSDLTSSPLVPDGSQTIHPDLGPQNEPTLLPSPTPTSIHDQGVSGSVLNTPGS